MTDFSNCSTHAYLLTSKWWIATLSWRWTWTYACCMSWTYHERFIRKHVVRHGSTSEHNTAPSEDLVFNRVNNAMLVPATGQPAGLEQSAERSKTHDSNTVRKFFWCFPLVNNWLYIVQHSYNEIPGHQSRYTCFHNFRGAMVHQSTDWKRKIMSSNPKKTGERRCHLSPSLESNKHSPQQGRVKAGSNSRLSLVGSPKQTQNSTGEIQRNAVIQTVVVTCTDHR